MNHLKTFEQHNTQEGEMVKEEFLDNIKSKIENFLDNPIDQEVADKLLQIAFAVTFNNRATKPYKQLVHNLPLEKKIGLLKDALEKLEYSPVMALRLLKNNLSNDFKVGSIKRELKEEPIQY